MYSPSLEEVEKLSSRGNLIPIFLEVDEHACAKARSVSSGCLDS